jgi:hypothetical protein
MIKIKYNTLIILLLTSFLVFSSCEKYFGEKTWTYRIETGCGTNPWSYTNSDNTETVVIDFLEGKNIKVYDFKIEIYSEGPFCLACTCPTGRKIWVLISDSDLKTINEFGFIQ